MIEAVLVTWRDAHADQTCDSWCLISELECDDAYLVRTVGWKLAAADGSPVKPGHVTVAQSFGSLEETPSIERLLVDSVLHIPVENVVSVLSLATHGTCTQTD